MELGVSGKIKREEFWEYMINIGLKENNNKKDSGPLNELSVT